MELVEVAGPLCELLIRPFLILLVACLLTTSLLRLLVYVVEPVSIQPFLHCRPSSLSRALVDTLPLMSQSYHLSRWSSSLLASAGTIWTRFVTIAALVLADLAPNCGLRHVRFVREYLQMKDDGLVSLDWALPVIRHQSDWMGGCSCWIVVLVPGRLICDSKTSLLPMCLSLIQNGHYPVIWNQRGCASTPITAPGLPSDPSDLRQVLEYLRNQHPHRPLALVGFSHSASLVISYLGEFGSSALVSAGMAISPIWDHQSSVDQVDWTLSTWASFKIKRWFLSLSCPAQCARQPLDVLFASNLRHLEEHLFMPSTSCPTMEDYWQCLSPLKDVDDIAVPLMVIHYEDDQIVSQKTLPRDLFGLYPHLLLLACPSGGHCGLMQRLQSAGGNTMADLLVGEFIREIHSFTVRQQGQKRVARVRYRGASLTLASRRSVRYQGRPSCSSC